MLSDRFSEFFQALHNVEPFEWQKRFADLIINGQWPEMVSVPTSAGKTAVIDVFVFALAMQADDAAARTVPLRLFHVIDRRLVVDEVTEHAARIAEKLEKALDPEAGAKPILREIAVRLMRFGGVRPLHVVALRGGMYRNESWARRPNQPTVGVSTIDQVGSRLLFRGYGLTNFRWPVHAGLLGIDTLFIIDEAHLAQPFSQTVQKVAAFQSKAELSVLPPLKLLCLSATPHVGTAGFNLLPSERTDSKLSPRLAAAKPAALVEVTDLIGEAVNHANRLAQMDFAQVIGIVVNRVSTARQVYSRLVAKLPGQVILMTGRIRPLERDQLLERYQMYIKASVQERLTPPGGQLFVVATQTVEVGTNIDFDVLITEAAPLSALRQRFGRLNRLGRPLETPAVIIRRKERGSDPVYGDELAVTWHWLSERASKAKGQKHPIIDFGVNALDEMMEQFGRPVERVIEAPVLLPTYIRQWSQTYERPHADPDVAPFLHGYDATNATDVNVVWRADLHRATGKRDGEFGGGNQQYWLDIVELAPPMLREAVPVPIWAVRRWLLDRDDADGIADITYQMDENARQRKNSGREVLIWRGSDSPQSGLKTASDIVPGDTIVVPVLDGGHDAFGWEPSLVEPVPDVGDREANAAAKLGYHRRRYMRVRLHSSLIASVGKRLQIDYPDQAEALALTWQTLNQSASIIPEIDATETFAAAVSELIALLPPDVLDPDAAEVLRNPERRKVTPYPDGSGWIVTALTIAGAKKLETDFSRFQTELLDDAVDHDLGLAATDSVFLHDHLNGVSRLVTEFAAAGGVPPNIIKDLAMVGQWHDLGKWDERFQALLYGGDEFKALFAEQPLAKSVVDLTPGQRKAVQRAVGYAPGSRHEFLSVSLLKDHASLLSETDDRDLVLYLIGTHHGRGRPLVPVVYDDEPYGVTATWGDYTLKASTNHLLWTFDSGWLELFWALNRRYGPWGLAFLEACIRLADGEQSAAEEGGNNL